MKKEDVLKCPFCRFEMEMSPFFHVHFYVCYRCHFRGPTRTSQRAAKQAIERIQLQRES